MVSERVPSNHEQSRQRACKQGQWNPPAKGNHDDCHSPQRDLGLDQQTQALNQGGGAFMAVVGCAIKPIVEIGGLEIGEVGSHRLSVDLFTDVITNEVRLCDSNQPGRRPQDFRNQIQGSENDDRRDDVTQSFRGSVAPSRTGEPIHDCAGEINHHYWKYALDHQEKAPRRRPPRSGTPHQTKGAGEVWKVASKRRHNFCGCRHGWSVAESYAEKGGFGG